MVAPDKLKGSLTAAKVATALAAGMEAHGLRCRLLPLADGGDDSVEVANTCGLADPATGSLRSTRPAAASARPCTPPWP
jgi:glycerate kinase